MISGWSKPIPALKLRSKARLVVVGADGCRALLEMEINTEDMMMTAIMVMMINKVITNLIGHWTKLAKNANIWLKITKNAYFGPNFAFLGPKP